MEGRVWESWKHGYVVLNTPWPARLPMLLYVNSPRSTRSAGTAAILQQAAQAGLPVLIPGALEVRAGRSTVRPAIDTLESVTRPALAVDGDERARREHEREGGGAPGERGHRTILARLSERLARAVRHRRP